MSWQLPLTNLMHLSYLTLLKCYCILDCCQCMLHSMQYTSSPLALLIIQSLKLSAVKFEKAFLHGFRPVFFCFYCPEMHWHGVIMQIKIKYSTIMHINVMLISLIMKWMSCSLLFIVFPKHCIFTHHSSSNKCSFLAPSFYFQG